MAAESSNRFSSDHLFPVLLVVLLINAALVGYQFAQARAFDDHVDQARALQQAASEVLKEAAELRDRLRQQSTSRPQSFLLLGVEADAGQVSSL